MLAYRKNRTFSWENTWGKPVTFSLVGRIYQRRLKIRVGCSSQNVQNNKLQISSDIVVNWKDEQIRTQNWGYDYACLKEVEKKTRVNNIKIANWNA